LTNLRKFALSYSYNLLSIPAEIGNLINLKKLEIGYNNLKTLPAEIGKLTNLKSLTLWNNNLSSIPAEIGNLKNLEKLDLPGALESLPAEIGKLTNLKILTYNYIAGIPEASGNLKNREELNLPGALESFPPEIGNLVNLQYIELGNNKITELPREIVNLEGLSIHGLDELLLDSISKSYLEDISVIVGVPYKKGRDKVIILKDGDWEIARNEDISAKTKNKYNDKENGKVIIWWKNGKISGIESFNFGNRMVGTMSSKGILDLKYLKQRLKQFKDDNLVKYKELNIWHISYIFISYKSKFPYIIPGAKWNFVLTWLIVITGVIGGFIFHRKKRRLYQWLCWGIAGITFLAVAGLYGYLLLA
jgi:Leucine-rich repeat (LRR) protein